MKKRNEETSKKMLFVVVGLSIGVPALARMIWKIWFLLAIFLIGENALNGLNTMLVKMADWDFIANLIAFFICNRSIVRTLSSLHFCATIVSTTNQFV